MRLTSVVVIVRSSVTITVSVYIVSAAVVVPVTASARHPVFVPSSVEPWQLLQERGHVPDVLVAHALAPGRHSRGLDTVFDDAEAGCALTLSFERLGGTG
ncbi:MAG: hypothetical protein ABI885_31095 [Gammaproteobacteria bacterium]